MDVTWGMLNTLGGILEEFGALEDDDDSPEGVALEWFLLDHDRPETYEGAVRLMDDYLVEVGLAGTSRRSDDRFRADLGAALAHVICLTEEATE
jgi:hypothetical protein